ncbi:ROK family protein [Candidatus Albibeggiatoa sp. nov. NOAA]|uniref:glucokinase n=1 Tax=Candidatus Albibeggiatoa sp. nov. NOAA TaxID=3162724 RepID=UPI0032F45430|nr:glucokinase [Thiotrichaceae bacterium]
MILAGDIGGTNCRLALYANAEAVKQRKPSSVLKLKIADFAHAEGWKQAVQHFLQHCNVDTQAIQQVCFGMAGPVSEKPELGRVCTLINVSHREGWTISEQALKDLFNCQAAFIINDMEAIAYAIPMLQTDELIDLNPDANPQIGNQALIAAGTGLGELLLFWERVNQKHLPSASEGGHSDFAPRTERQWQLWQYVKDLQQGSDCPNCIVWERLVSGSGLVKIYQFLWQMHRGLSESPIDNLSEPAAYITDTALSNQDTISVETLKLFMQLYGAEAGNLALKYWAVNGVFIGGGIAPKIWNQGQGKVFFEIFMQSFTNKEDVYAEKNAMMPVKMILNTDIGLLGAAQCAISY